MYAIIEVKGKQYKVTKGAKILIDYLGENAAAPEIKTLFVKKDDNSVSIGAPYVANAKVTATVAGERKGDKVLVFRFIKRKDFRRLRGHRQKYSRLLIEDISA
ncbi:MAG: 50S ribosomal protein L21 [Spirochaetota bacterium]